MGELGIQADEKQMEAISHTNKHLDGADEYPTRKDAQHYRIFICSAKNVSSTIHLTV